MPFSISLGIPSSASITRDVFREHDGLRPSESPKDLGNQARMRRSYSDNHISATRVSARVMEPKLKTSRSFGVFPFQISTSIIPNSLRTFLFDPETSKDVDVVDKPEELAESEEDVMANNEEAEVTRANWVERILQIRSHWLNRQPKDNMDVEGEDDNSDFDYDHDDEEGCMVDYDSDEDGGGSGRETYNRKTFSRFLSSVPWSDIRLFSKLAFLSNMAYVIPEIKGMDLRSWYGLQFVTSSLERKSEATAIRERLDQDSTRVPITTSDTAESNLREVEGVPEHRSPMRPYVAYEIAASAATYVQSRSIGLSTCKSDSSQEDNCLIDSSRGVDQPDGGGKSSPRVYKSEVAACVTASTMTAVVAAGEKEKEEAARDLQSLHSSPCEWFICDDPSTYTRCFVIQGSESKESWYANLLFEPAKFEGTEVLVHRGIYEAAKGIYEQFLPEITEFLDMYGERAKFQFTGHSLGGSLSLLVHLMLIKRNVVKRSTLRPVVTFGSPFIFCGGQKLLKDLGLDESDIHSVIMHRDIVPRAFSCIYPDHIAILLKRLSGTFRSHPCLNKNKLLYAPLGKIFILQPDEETSPAHPLLPPGRALYTLDKTRCGFSTSVIRTFLNCPHPLQTLSNPTAYGSEGTILRDHDSNNYLKAINEVLRQNTKTTTTTTPKEGKHMNVLWPLLAGPSPRSWNRGHAMESNILATKEVMTH